MRRAISGTITLSARKADAVHVHGAEQENKDELSQDAPSDRQEDTISTVEAPPSNVPIETAESAPELPPQPGSQAGGARTSYVAVNL
jgi:hypothetical protein